MKEKLFKLLFPQKHQEIMSLTKKLNSESMFVELFAKRNMTQEATIVQLRKDLYEIREAERKHLHQKDEESKREYYDLLRQKGIV